MLGENKESVLENEETVNTFNNHVGFIGDKLRLDHLEDHSLSQSQGFDRIHNIIKRYKNSPSVKSIKRNSITVHGFSFQCFSLQMMLGKLF